MSRGGADDIAPHTMSLLSREKQRGPADLSHARWRPSAPVPLCPLGTVFFRPPPPAHGPVANAPCPRGARPCRPHSRGRAQRGATAGQGEQTSSRARARAPPGWQKPRRLCALTPPWLQPIMAGAALDTRGQKTVAPDASPGWTVVWRDRATRVLGDMPWGRHERTRWKKARERVWQVIAPTGERTRRTDGARRSGSRGDELGRPARRTGTRGRPQKTLPTGGPVRRKPQGSHRQTRGPQRPTSPAPSPAPPDTAQSLATPAMQAQHLAAFPPALRRRGAASRRRTHRSAKHPGRLQAR